MTEVVNTVTDSLVSVGIDNVDRFNGQTNARRLAADLFNDDFGSFSDKIDDKIEADLKTYLALTVANGRISLQPGQKRSVRVAMQWVIDLIRTDQDPIITPMPAVMNSVALMYMYQKHASFVKKSSTFTTTAKPSNFLPSSR